MKKLIILLNIVNNINIFCSFETFLKNKEKIHNYYQRTMYADFYGNDGKTKYFKHKEGCDRERECSCEKETHDIGCSMYKCSASCTSESNELLKLYALEVQRGGLIDDLEKNSEFAGWLRNSTGYKLFRDDLAVIFKYYINGTIMKPGDTFFTNPIVIEAIKISYNKHLTDAEKCMLNRYEEEVLKILYDCNR